MKHLLIDFETTQPSDLNRVNADNVCIWLLLGTKQQDNLPLDLCESLCRFGGNIRFVRVRGGSGALSVYLGFYIGQIISEDPKAVIAVLSHNDVYDALVEHLATIVPEAEITRTAAVGGLPEHFRLNYDDISDKPSVQEPVGELHIGDVLDKYYPAIVQAMGQKDAYHPRHRRNLTANIERYLSQYEHEIGTLGKTAVAEQVLVRLQYDGFIKDLGDGLLSYHFDRR